MNLYPLKFKEVYKDYIWGGKGLDKIGKKVGSEKIAESWEIACHKDGMSVVAEGDLKGKSLSELVLKYGKDLLGSRIEENEFPLLVKFINAKNNLSVQVHPDDEYAYANEGERGKNEAWVVLYADDDAKMIIDVAPNIDRDSFKMAVESNNAEECLNTISVQAGDIINIPAGLVHAIGEGIILAEIQQNSNTTYRVYDYNRRDANGNERPLHVKKALDVIDFSKKKTDKKAHGITLGIGESSIRTIAVANEYFCIEKFVMNEKLRQVSTRETFLIYIFTKGEGKIFFDENNIDVKMGDTYLVPANMGEFFIEGDLQFIKSYIPNIDKDIFGYLEDMGYSKEKIVESIDGLR
jgi:mannose-6-phosphate isomerase